MKVLFIGDIHIKFNNIDVVQQLTHLNVDADIAILAGDVLDSHERVHTQLMNRAIDLIATLSRTMPTYVLVGNHDYVDNSQFCSTNHWMTAIRRFGDGRTIVVDSPIRVGDLIMVPYVPVGRFAEALDTFVPGWTTASCIFAHQEFRGCKMGAISSETGDEWSTALPQVISGHIHEKHRPQSNIYYPGSVSDTQAVVVFHLDRDTYSEHPVRLDVQRKTTIHLSIEELAKLRPPFDPNVRYAATGGAAATAAYRRSGHARQLRAACRVVFGVVAARSRPRSGFAAILAAKLASEPPAVRRDYASLVSDDASLVSDVASPAAPPAAPPAVSDLSASHRP